MNTDRISMSGLREVLRPSVQAVPNNLETGRSPGLSCMTASASLLLAGLALPPVEDITGREEAAPQELGLPSTRYSGSCVRNVLPTLPPPSCPKSLIKYFLPQYSARPLPLCSLLRKVLCNGPDTNTGTNVTSSSHAASSCAVCEPEPN